MSAQGFNILALNCSLKPSPQSSSTDKLLQELMEALASGGGKGEIVRIAESRHQARGNLR